MQVDPNPLPWKFTAMQRADGKWCVFAAHDESPEWYRLIAEFGSRDRAESYVAIENDIADEGDPHHHDDIHPAPQSLPTAPVNRVTSERLTVRTSVERREVEVTREPMPLVVEAAPVERIEAPKKPSGRASLPDDEADRRLDAVLGAIKRHVAENNVFPSMNQIADGCDVPAGSVPMFVVQLEHSGALSKSDDGRRFLPDRPDCRSQLRGEGRARPKSDEEMIAEHLATKGVTKLPPAATAETTASLKSKFTHVIEPKAGRPTQASKAASAIADYQRNRTA